MHCLNVSLNTDSYKYLKGYLQDMKYYVYQLRANDEDQPFYIGKSFEGSKRLVEHRYDSRKTKRMKSTKMRSIEERGAETLEEILFEFDYEEQAHKKEIELIAHYGRRDLGTGILCNHTSGGEGIVGQVITEETRKKMSKAKKGNKINVGRKRPDFAAMWMKPITVFDIDGNILFHCNSSKEAVELTGVSKPVVSDCVAGKTRTAKGKDGHVYRFREGHLTQQLEPIKYRQRTGLGSVNQFTKDGKFVAQFHNAKQAEDATKVASVSIRRCIHGKAKTAGGFIWKLAV